MGTKWKKNGAFDRNIYSFKPELQNINILENLEKYDIWCQENCMRQIKQYPYIWNEVFSKHHCKTHQMVTK